MSSPTQKPANAWQWLDPRGRESGGWAFILNRISAIGLTVYLFLHLVVLGKLAQGAEAFDSFIEMAESPLFIAGELLVIVAGIYHGLNGLRLIMNSFGIAVPYQKELFYIVILLTLIGGIMFALRMVAA